MVENMQMVNILAPEKELNRIIAVCIDAGCFHLEDSPLAEGYAGFLKLNEENPYGEKLRAMLEVLDYCSITPKLTFSKDTVFENEELDSVLAALQDSLHELHTDREKYKNEIEQCRKNISQLSHFLGLDLNISRAIHSNFIKVRFGKLSRDGFAKIKEYTAENPYILFTPCSVENDFYWGVYMTPSEYVEQADRVFASLFFERLRLPDGAGEPEELIEGYKKQLEAAEKALKETEEIIDWYFIKHGDDFLKLYSQIKREYDIFEYRRYATKYKDKFIMLSGWVPLSEVAGFEEKIKTVEGCSVVDIAPEGSDKKRITPPTKMKNPKLFRPFQFFVEIYGVPGYNEVDPTAFLAITYTLLYGIMFADVGQGLVLALVGYLMYKLKKMPLGRALIPCGISGCIFGFVFGSVFGFEEVLNPLYQALGFSEKPFPVMDNAVNLLALSVGIGIVLIIMALFMGVIAGFKKKNYGDAIFGANGIAGLVLYLSVLVLAGGMLLGISLPTLPIVLIGIVLPVVLIFLHVPLGSLVSGEGFKIEGVGDFILENFFELFEVLLGYFTNTISFLRVGAFVLIHAGMMMAFTALSEMVGGGVAGAVMMIFGNAFVIALEGLLVGIQVLRLEFYEMFSRFYEGDGRPFTPVRIKAD